MGHALVINVFSTLSGRETVNGWSGHSGHITGLKSGVNERSNTSYKHLTPAQNRKRFRELVKQKMSPGFPAQATFYLTVLVPSVSPCKLIIQLLSQATEV
jgi:hypothetical protein